MRSKQFHGVFYLHRTIYPARNISYNSNRVLLLKVYPKFYIYSIKTFYKYYLFQGFSCVDLLNAGMRQSGVFYLQIRGTTYWFLKVFCEQEVADGGWTVNF